MWKRVIFNRDLSRVYSIWHWTDYERPPELIITMSCNALWCNLFYKYHHSNSNTRVDFHNRKEICDNIWFMNMYKKQYIVSLTHNCNWNGSFTLLLHFKINIDCFGGMVNMFNVYDFNLSSFQYISQLVRYRGCNYHLKTILSLRSDGCLGGKIIYLYCDGQLLNVWWYSIPKPVLS